MGKVIASMFVSADGYIADEAGRIDWFVGRFTDLELDRVTNQMLERTGTIVGGARVFNALASYWPTSASHGVAYAEKMNTLTKLVFSRGSSSVSWGDWDNASLATRTVAEETTRLRAASDSDIVIFGGPGLIADFTRDGLIDVYRLQVCPVALGAGQPFFANVAGYQWLRLLSVRAFSSGVTELRYAPAASRRP
jgi:dihydrofolate reductase